MFHKKYFTDKVKERLHGTGQGTGWSPILWVVICDVIISVLDENHPGQVFKSPTGEIEAKQTLDAFVDDSNLSVNKQGVEKFNKKDKLNSGTSQFTVFSKL